MINPAGEAMPKPATNTNHVRLYEHNLCPFCARARYYLSCKEIPFQCCEIDLNEKAQWHKDFNGGTAPFMEMPTGVMVPESGIIQQWAQETNPDGGISLIPSDPLEAAKMRVRMEKFMKTIPNMFGIIMARGTDVEGIQKYKDETLPLYEQMCTEAAGKFLMGTEDLTALDIHIAPFWEMIFLYERGTYANVDEVLKIRENAPNWCAYVEKFRNHPLIKPHRYNAKASEAQAVRSRAWPVEEKC